MRIRNGKLGIPLTSEVNPVDVDACVPVFCRPVKQKPGMRKQTAEITKSMLRIMKTHKVKLHTFPKVAASENLEELCSTISKNAVDVDNASVNANAVGATASVKKTTASDNYATSNSIADVNVPSVEAPGENSLTVSGNVEIHAVAGEVNLVTADAHVENLEEGSSIMSGNVESFVGCVDNYTPNVVPAAAEVIVSAAAEVYIPSDEVPDEGKGAVAEVSNVGFSISSEADKVVPPVEFTRMIRYSYKRRVGKRVTPFLPRKLADRCPGSNDDDSSIQIDGNKKVLAIVGPVGASEVDKESLSDAGPVGAGNDLNEACHATDEMNDQNTDEVVLAAVLAAMSYATDENNHLYNGAHLEDTTLQECGNNDDKDVSEKEDDVEKVVAEDLRGLKESKGKMVAVLKSRKRRKVSASKKFDPVAVDTYFKASGKRVADKSEVVKKKLKNKAKVEMMDTIPEDSAQNLRTTCQLDKFVHVIDQLTAAQIRAVEEIGFGGLLKFNIRSVPKDLVQTLVKHFNSTTLFQDIGSERYAVDKNDVYDMFQLPISDQPVVEVSHKGLAKDVVPADGWIRAIWFEKYASKDGVVTVKDLYTEIPGLVDDEQMEEFKRVFVMFAVSCFLAPAARSLVDLQIVTSLQNVDTISGYDWCGFVLKRFRATLSRVENSEKFSSINACLIIPLLAFFYRYPIPGVVDPIELPLHKHWDTEKVKKRCDVFRGEGYSSFVRGTRHFPLTDNGILIGDEYNQLCNDVHLEDITLQECGNNDDNDVSEKEDDAGSDSDDEDWIEDDAVSDSDDEDWIEKVVAEDLRDLKESNGKMVPVLKNRKRQKVSASKKFYPSVCFSMAFQKFVNVNKSVIAFGSKKHKGRKGSGKRVADNFEVAEKRLKKKAKVEMVDTIPEDSAQILRTTCQLDKFVDVIDQLTAAQIRAVEEIGFGGLLKFNIRSVSKDLVQNLVEHFNSIALVQDIGSERYALDKNDVYDMFQLPISDQPVVEVSHKGLAKDVVPADKWIRAIWLEKYASKDGIITVKDLYTKIPDLVDDDDQMEEFKRVFVMFALSCFLAPAARSIVDMQIVTSLQNVDAISSYDWCGFVLKRFCATLSRVENSKKFSSVNVCLIIPLLAFFYRYPIPGVVDPIELPLHKHWDTEKVKKRCSVYRRGGYTSFLRGTRHFPLTDNGMQIGAASTGKNPSQASSTRTKHGFIQLELSDDILDDEEIERLAKSPLEVATMKLKRLVSIASDQYVQALARINEGEERPAPRSEDVYTPKTIAQIDAMVSEVMEEKAKRAQLSMLELLRFSRPRNKNV